MLSGDRILKTAAAVLLGLVLAAPVFAQLPPPPPDGSRVRDAVEQTERRIQHARDLLSVSPGNATAAAELDQAVALQAIARQALTDGRLAAAGRATFDARIHADRAIALLQGLPDPGRVQDQLNRTREILDRARDRLARCDVPAVRELMRTAIDMQFRAEQAYGETRYLAALQLTMSARERALRAQQLCNAGESLEETVSAALQRTDDILERAHEVVARGGNERSTRLLENADSLQARAKAEAQANHPRVALRLTRMAREQADRAMRGSSRAGHP